MINSSPNTNDDSRSDKRPLTQNDLWTRMVSSSNFCSSFLFPGHRSQGCLPALQFSENIINSISTAMTAEVHCYNKGCGKTFDPASNEENACVHHPGVPVFHDALKGWSCCKRRTTDFSDFLNIPGCSKGLHNSEKPAEPVVPKVTSSKNKDIQEKFIQEAPQPTPKPLSSVQITVRPSADEPMIPLPMKTTPSLQKSLDKLSLEAKNEDSAAKQIKVCKHSSCKQVFSPGMNETCIHHPGVPVFHEGMKYWSCCNRKTSDFTSFLAQEGCVTSTHEWKLKSLVEAVPCRYDWHQTGSQVVVSIFAKTAIAENSSVKVNQVKADVEIEFEGGKRTFQLLTEFGGVIDPSRSFVTLYGTKVEITLKKADASRWSKLEIPKPVIQDENGGNLNQETPKEEEIKAEPKVEKTDTADNDSDSDLSGIDDVEFD